MRHADLGGGGDAYFTYDALLTSTEDRGFLSAPT